MPHSLFLTEETTELRILVLEATNLEMEARFEFFRMLNIELVLTILMCLDDPADLIRASAVSKSWEMLVISYGLSKKLCVKRLPQLASIDIDIIEQSFFNSNDDTSIYAIIQKEHKVYTSLLRALNSFRIKFCIAHPISASSTDHYPQESIVNTSDPRDQILDRASYWSSKGHYNREVPENLIYKMSAGLCVITEIVIAPFQAMFQDGHPIYSSRFVRFRMGHAKSYDDFIYPDFVASQENAEDKFVWTYTSEIFPMAQESRLQSFKFPEPVLCIGGFMQIELLGRIQKQQSDGKYYICLSHVQAIGRKLAHAFCLYVWRPYSNKISLIYNSERFNDTLLKDASGADDSPLNINLLPYLPPRDLVWANYLQDTVDMIHEQQNALVNQPRANNVPTANNVPRANVVWRPNEEFMAMLNML